MNRCWPKLITAATLLILWSASALGCRREPSTSTKPAASQVVVAAKANSEVEKNERSKAPTPTAETIAAEAPTDLAPSESAAPGDVAATTSSTAEPSGAAVKPSEPANPITVASPPPKAERILLLAPGGPLLVDLIMTIDGRSYDEPLADVVANATLQADENQDGRATWDEVMASPNMRYGSFGNLPSRGDSDRDQLVRMYDVNRNGLADNNEMRRFLTRNAAASMSFHLRSSNFYRGADRWDSAIRTLLDTDQDGVLDAAELSDAVSRLKAHDADDDQALVLQDLLEVRPMDVAPLQQRRVDEAEAAIHLNAIRDWGPVQYSMEELYALGQSLHAAAFSREPHLYAELDENADGELRLDEFPRLLELAPHLVLELAFGSPTEDNQAESPSMLKLVSHPRDVPVEITQSDSAARLTCAWSDVVVVFFARDAIDRDMMRQAQQQIAMVDANNDGYLEEKEATEFFENTAAPFAALDVNLDGKVYPEELARFREKQQATARSQLRARAGHDRDALFTALDDNHDGRLTAREVENVPQRIRAMDHDGDERITVDEIPTAMLLGVIRSDAQGVDEQLFTPPTAASFSSTESPPWFTSMDVNRDREISRREFLGDLEVFDALDQDHDGFLSVLEATKE